MKLSEFVEETLSQITEGVLSAQARTEEHGATVNPRRPGRGRMIQKIEFDVALTTVESDEKSGGIQVFGIGGKMEKAGSSSSVSRVSFYVSVELPEGGD